MEVVLIQVADTVACGSVFGLTAETLIDAQMILVEPLDGMTAISESIALTRIPVGSILKVATYMQSCRVLGKHYRWKMRDVGQPLRKSPALSRGSSRSLLTAFQC